MDILDPAVFLWQAEGVWILGQWFGEQVVERIKGAVDAEPGISRRTLGRRVCEWLGWRGADGAPRETSGRKALAELEKRGVMVLPKGSTGCFERRLPKQEQTVVEVAAPEVECGLEELGEVSVTPVSSRYSKEARLWGELMEAHHYLGGGPLCGAQIRYLIWSEAKGVLGGLSFSGASKRLKKRDEWIGWSERARRANLAKVICNSRFLICPGVRVPNLGSMVLGLALKRVGKDWQERYGYEPVLVESFVDRQRFQGTVYQAANFEVVGETAGRAGGFANGKRSTGKKEILVRALQRDFRKILCQEAKEPLVVRGRAADAEDWAGEEFGGAQVFDGRLRRRLINLARDFYKQPGKAIPQICGGVEAKAKAAYRFMNNRGVEMEMVLGGHISSTVERAQQQEVILAVQDTTTINYTTHRSAEGLGPINTTQDNGRGLILHSTIAFTLEGTPLGVLDAQCWARDPQEAGKSKKRKEKPIEEKESQKWLQSYRVVAQAQRLSPGTMFVSVGDREADIHELFVEAQQTEGGPKVLIRADRGRQRKVRKVDDEQSPESYEYLWEQLSKEQLSGTLEIRVPRQGNRRARDTTLEIRFARVEIKAPRKKPHLAPVEVYAVYAREVDYGPDVTEPIDWMILTTVAVTSFEEAVERVRWYAQRWGIEVFHRVLKSGCRIEDRLLGDAESIKNSLAIDMVVAWRIHYLTKQGRETPEISCEVMFEQDEWKVLCAATRHQPPPSKPPTLWEAVLMVAKLGGFLGRKCDGAPGTQTTWRGLIVLAAMTEGYRLAAQIRDRDGP